MHRIYVRLVSRVWGNAPKLLSAAIAGTALACGASAATEVPAEISVRAYGARGDGKALDTDAINSTIAAVAAGGGGTVVFPAGDYLSYSIHLRSHITLFLAPGATLIAADPPRPGEPGGYDAAEPSGSAQFQDFGHCYWHNSLIWGEDLVDVSIRGPGKIYGRGLSRGNGRISSPVGAVPPIKPGATNLPDVLEADGDFAVPPRPGLVPGPFGYPSARDWLPNGVGNKAVALKNCRNVQLRDFTILHGGHFGILATGVDNLTIDNLLIDTNRDGFDVDSCSNVRISNCSVNSPWDDGICLKASYALNRNRPTENVTIANCFVSGFDEGTLLDGTRQRRIVHRGGPMGRIKLGTEANGGFRNIAITNCVFEYCRGLALEQVDGGMLEDIAISNITMRDIPNAPLFIRLGARLRGPAGTATGTLRRILVSNLVASNVAAEHGILILGVPTHPIEDVVLQNIRIEYNGGGTAEQVGRIVPELEKGYPEPWNFGRMPTWGMFARHVSNLQLHNIKLSHVSDDQRPAVAADDVDGIELDNVGLDAGKERSVWSFVRVSRLNAHNATGLTDGTAEHIERAVH